MVVPVPCPLIIGIRFMYGFRLVGPIVLGISRVSAAKVLVFNFFGPCIWAILVAGVGFVFGQGLELVLTGAKRYAMAGLGVIALIGMVLWVVFRFRRR